MALASLLLTFSSAAGSTSIDGHLSALLAFGPRETGSIGNQRAREYLVQQLRTLGYETRLDSFAYRRYQDYGSSVSAETAHLDARALLGSVRGTVDGPVRWVAGIGRPSDFVRAGVRGRIAVVMRGGMLFRDKARHARDAGAVALIIVNSEAGVYRGAIGETVGIPVLSVGLSASKVLRDGSRAQLHVRVEREVREGVNVRARHPQSTPRIVFGAHYDSFIHSPGINDNASGVVATLQIAADVRGTPLERESEFVFFDAEEDRFHGSRAYVRANRTALARLKGMLNLDMVGVNASALSVTGSADLVSVARKRLVGVRTFSQAGLSDHESFLAAGVPALFFFRGIDPNYHLPSDTTASPHLIREAASAALVVAQELSRAARPAPVQGPANMQTR